MEAPQCQLQDFVDSFPIIAVSSDTLSINQTVDPLVSSAFTRAPLAIAKFGMNDRESAINPRRNMRCSPPI